MLADGEADEAWDAATAGAREVSTTQWLRLAETREPTAPADAMAVCLRLADEVLVPAEKRAHREAIRHLKATRRAATAADRLDEFNDSGPISPDESLLSFPGFVRASSPDLGPGLVWGWPTAR